MKFEKFPFKVEKQYRLQGYDYSRNGYYFITICAKDHINYFGEIKNNCVELTQIGKITQNFWLQIPQKFKNIYLDEFVIMSNHIHGILIINNKIDDRYCKNMPRPNNNLINCRNMPRHVPTDNKNFQIANQFSKPIKNSVSMVINHFKGSVTKFCNQNNFKFQWQPRFHDRIIRNEKEYFAIKQYIKDFLKIGEKIRKINQMYYNMYISYEQIINHFRPHCYRQNCFSC